MGKYIKTQPRLSVDFIDGDTEEILFTIKNRSWMDVGDVLKETVINNLIDTELKGKPKPKNLMVLVVNELTLND